MPHRIEVGSVVPDTRASVRKDGLCQLDFGGRVSDVEVVDVFTIDKDFNSDEMMKIGSALSNPVTQRFAVDGACEVGIMEDNAAGGRVWAVEVGFLPGVTDNIGTTSREIIEDLLKVKFEDGEAVYTSQVTFVRGDLSREEAQAIGESMANTLIQRIHVKSAEEYKHDGGMDTVVPKVNLEHKPRVDEVDLNISDEELRKIGKEGIANSDGTRRGPLALDMDYLQTIKEHFASLGRKATDLELESLAQTWSEHCKHTIFAAQMDEIEEGIYKYYIKRATNDVRAAKGDKDFCVSVFHDNAGGIVFDENWIISDKVETHNSPSALDPFGGAITGIVGVNRDTVGFGKGAKPVINRYGYCFADPRDSSPIYKGTGKTQKMLPPRRILEGVVEGVNVGGNCSGIPTPQGFMHFDSRYKGKPLVFVGTVGLIPRKVCGKPSWEKKAQAGDKVVVVGGRVGQDGIHGATFSSEVMDSGSPSTAVQIGDPITQKKFSDAIVKEARDLDLYNSITDCGAGGISCSIAEMARECGGCSVDLDKVPLKYPGLDPWQIWISESQERMTLSIPPEKVGDFMNLMERRGVEATVVGEFTDSGKCEVFYEGQTVMDLDLDFLHDGLPKRFLKTTYTRPEYKEPDFTCPADLTKTFVDLVGRLNVASFDFVSHQYDHVVQCGHVLGPLAGRGRVNSKASVSAPVLGSHKGVALSQGINARYGDIDTYHMAACAIDTAVRNTVAAGVNLDKLALLDNFCWCSSNEAERLGQLKETARACYDYAVAYGTPFISGKDSMFNDFSGFDEDGKPVKISVPPTLLVSSIGVVDDFRKSPSLEAKFAGDSVYVLGETREELGASEYFDYMEFVGNKVPQVDAEKNMKTYRAVEAAIGGGLLASCESVSLGGLGVSLARAAIGGGLGMDLSLAEMPCASDAERGASADGSGAASGGKCRPDFALFSETQGRFVVTVAPDKQAAFEKHFGDAGVPFGKLGTVRDNDAFVIDEVVKTDISTLNESYRLIFKNY
jgi:phosphoribosylformylglycinamidine synthase subunit PurSL